MISHLMDLIEQNPVILGGKPIIKGTRIPVDLVYELVALNYNIEEIVEEYPSLSRETILKLLELGRDEKEKNIARKGHPSREI